MEHRALGTRKASVVGVGAMWLSLTSGRPGEKASVDLLHRAFDAGITHVDAADSYALDAYEMGHNERLVSKAVSTWDGDSSQITVATKGGHTRDTAGGWGLNGTAEYLRRACEKSRKALGVERIHLFYYHRPDPETPIELTAEALASLREEGLVENVGLSNVSIEQIEKVSKFVSIAAVQNEFSPRFRSNAQELAYCEDRSIAFIPWRCFGGISDPAERSKTYAAFDAVSTKYGATAQQVCLAWCLQQASNVLVIPGMTRIETMLSSVAASDLRLDSEDMAALDATPHADIPST